MARLHHHWSICSSCEGEGKSSAYLGDFSQSDMAEDPEFAEAYFDGAYDRACPDCKGLGRVEELNELLPGASFGLRRLHVLAMRDAECAQVMAQEQRMRDRGYQF